MPRQKSVANVIHTEIKAFDYDYSFSERGFIRFNNKNEAIRKGYEQ